MIVPTRYYCAFRTLFLFSVVISISPLAAQEIDQNYFILNYIQVEPEHESDFINLEISVWKKVHQARITAERLDGWYFFRIVAPTGSNCDYNYVTVEAYHSTEQIAEHFEGLGVNLGNILSADELSQAIKTNELSTMVYEEVWKSTDQMLDIIGERIFKYQIFNSMSLREGTKDEDYLRIEQTYWKPMHRERMRRGEMKGWGIYNMMIPGGTEREYHWATVDFYDNLNDYLKPTDGILEAIHGKKNAQKYITETEAKRDLLKAEIRELIDFTSVNIQN